MSKYQVYGTMLDDLARKRFSDYEKAKAHYEKARRDYDSLPVKFRIDAIKDADYILQKKKREVTLIEAEKSFNEARKVYESMFSEAEFLRTALYNEVREDNKIIPKDLDKNTVDLLSSGACTPEEIVDLFESSNTTTKRYIAKYAQDKINENPKIEGYSFYNKVSIAGRALIDPNYSDVMRNFDSALDVLKRCVRNPGMIGFWGQLTEETFSNM